MKKTFLYNGPISDELRPGETYELEESEPRTVCLIQLKLVEEIKGPASGAPKSKRAAAAAPAPASKRSVPPAAEAAPKTQRAPRATPAPKSSGPKSKKGG